MVATIFDRAFIVKNIRKGWLICVYSHSRWEESIQDREIRDVLSNVCVSNTGWQ